MRDNLARGMSLAEARADAVRRFGNTALLRDRTLDADRLAFLEHAWTRVLGPGDDARAAALLPHLVLVGASVSSGVGPEELGAVFRLLARLVPAQLDPEQPEDQPELEPLEQPDHQIGERWQAPCTRRQAEELM